jgi:outer membrane cobalamin receptor
MKTIICTKKAKWLILITAILWSTCGTGLAQSGFLDNATKFWSSGKRFQPESETASTVEIITAEDIENSGFTNLGDVFRMVVGIDIRESDAMQHVLGIRGYCDAGHTLVLIDGSTAFFRSSNYSYVDWLPIALEEIERIEIVKGPMSALYGGNAFSGVINIITKNPKDLEHLRANVVYGELNTLRTSIMTGGTIRKTDFSVAAEIHSGDAWDKETNLPLEDNFNKKHFSVKGVRKFSNHKRLTLNLRFADSDNVLSRIDHATTRTVSALYEVNNNSSIRFSNLVQKRDMFSVDGGYDYDPQYHNTERSSEIEYLRRLQWRKSHLTFGVNSRFTENVMNYLHQYSWYGYSSEYFWVHQHSVFTDLESRLSNKIVLNLGARLSYHRDLDLLNAFRMSFLYSLNPKNRLKLFVSKGYYLPSLLQQYFRQSGYYSPDYPEMVKPESIYSTELSYSNTRINNLELKLNVFATLTKDRITGSYFADGKQNREETPLTYGTELDASFRISKNVKVHSNVYLFQVDEEYYNAPNRDIYKRINLILESQINKFTCFVLYSYNDGYFELFSNSDPFYQYYYNEVVSDRVESYSTLNANISYRINEQFRINIAAYNALNNKHYESSSTEWFLKSDQIGRRFTIGVHVSL